MTIKDNSITKGFSQFICKRTSPGGNADLFLHPSAVKFPRSVDGVKLPSFRKLVAAKTDATTPMTAIFTDSVMRPCILNWFDNSFGNARTCKSNVWGQYSPGSLLDEVNSTFSVADENVAKAKCLARLNDYVRNNQTPFQAQIFAGELKETIQFLRHPLEASTKLVESHILLAEKTVFKKVLKARNSNVRKDIIAANKALADSWLELRFAVLPLIDDINNLLHVINNDEQIIDRNRFYAQNTVVGASAIQQTNADALIIRQTRRFVWKYEYIVRVGFIQERLQRVNGLQNYLEASLKDVTQVLPTIWELTPYSFLIDYFVNIGDIVNAPSNIKTFANYVCASQIKTAKRTDVPLDLINNGVTINSVNLLNNEFGCETTFRKVVRSSISSTVPPVVFTVPTSGIRLANMSALLTKLL